MVGLLISVFLGIQYKKDSGGLGNIVGCTNKFYYFLSVQGAKVEIKKIKQKKVNNLNWECASNVLFVSAVLPPQTPN